MSNRRPKRNIRKNLKKFNKALETKALGSVETPSEVTIEETVEATV